MYTVGMAANDRNNPVNRPSSDSEMSLVEFMRAYPDDAACLDRLWRDRYAPDGHTADCPKCEKPRRFHRTKTRASYTCDSCGLHIHPMVGTIFEKSSTSLQLWFYAIYLIASTRCGISAKQLERELGVSYKTAWRMMNKIRNDLMNDTDATPLDGFVEVDETGVSGKKRKKGTRSEGAIWREAQPVVLGMVERGGRVRMRVITSRRGEPLSGAVRANVNPTSIIFTDDWMAYKPLGREYAGHSRHQPLRRRVRHRGQHPYEHDRGVLREPQDRDARRVQARLAPVASVLPRRVRMALQRTPRARLDVRAVDRSRR
jgi:transposase-like protein